jgi:SNF2 family DNA or RNA helicase
MGKTSETLMAHKLLKAKGLINRTLVIAPLRAATTTWPAEQKKWDEFKGIKVVVLHGPKKEDLLFSDADVCVINPEGLRWLFGHKHLTFDMLVVDESTRFKHANTIRFKALKAQLNKFRRRYILTGSPAPNGLLDLFGQIYILDGGHALGAYLTHYRLNYFDNPDRQGWEWVLRPGAERYIYEKLKPLVLRMSAEDYLDLPELIYNTVEVELPPDARRAYDEMEALLISALEEGTVVAANAAAATGKCRQLAGGGVYTGNARESFGLHSAKIDAVEDLIEELSGKPALVAYEFDHERIRLQERFPNAPYIGGGVSAGKFAEIERDWNMGRIPVLLAQPQSVAHGLNLQGVGGAVIFMQPPWDLEVREQFIRRVWRQGQKERVFVHDIVALNTVDQAIHGALGRKDRTQRALLAALKDYTKERK